MRYWIATWLLALLPPTRAFGLKRAALRSLGIPVGEGTRVCGRVAFFGGGRIAIGRDCWIGIGATFYTAGDGGDIRVGDRCDIAPEAAFHCGSHEIGDRARRASNGVARAVTIGDGCWIGLRATILPGASIAAGCVVAAGAVVAADLPADTLAGGVPARAIRALP